MKDIYIFVESIIETDFILEFHQSEQRLVIIPTYNEKENIENLIRKVFQLTLLFIF